MITETVKVSGMSCGHCVAAVSDEITKIDGVTSVEIDLNSGNVEMTSDRELDPAAVSQAVEDAGYHLSS